MNKRATIRSAQTPLSVRWRISQWGNGLEGRSCLSFRASRDGEAARSSRETVLRIPPRRPCLRHAEQLSIGGEDSKLWVGVDRGERSSETAHACAVRAEEPKMQHLIQGAFQCEWVREAQRKDRRQRDLRMKRPATSTKASEGHARGAEIFAEVRTLTSLVQGGASSRYLRHRRWMLRVRNEDANRLRCGSSRTFRPESRIVTRRRGSRWPEMTLETRDDVQCDQGTCKRRLRVRQLCMTIRSFARCDSDTGFSAFSV